jgi:hypothetical protein
MPPYGSVANWHAAVVRGWRRAGRLRAIYWNACRIGIKRFL